MRPESEEPAQPLGRILRGLGTKPQDSQVLSLSGSQWEAGFPADGRRADTEASGLCHSWRLDCGPRRATPPGWLPPVPPHGGHRDGTLALKRGVLSLNSWEGSPACHGEGPMGQKRLLLSSQPPLRAQPAGGEKQASLMPWGAEPEQRSGGC